MAWYRFFADTIVVLHLAYVLLVVLPLPAIVVGAYFGWSWVRNFWFRMIHFAMIAVVAAESILGIVCPLTTWENRLRVKAGAADYEGSFMGHWAHELLFFDAPAWVFTVIYCLVGALVLVTLLLAPPRWPWRQRRAT